MEGRYNAPLGVQGNAWSNAATGAATNSAVLNTFSCPFVSAVGHVGGATTITLMLSMDGLTFYAGPTQVLAGAADFAISATVGVPYVALQSTNNVTATATLAAKP